MQRISASVAVVEHDFEELRLLEKLEAEASMPGPPPFDWALYRRERAGVLLKRSRIIPGLIDCTRAA